MSARKVLEHLAARALLAALRWMPYRASLRAAETAGLLGASMVGRWRRVADRNLRRAFPGMDAAERTRVRRGVYRNLGRVAFGLAKIPAWTPDQIRRRVSFSGLRHYEAALGKGRGVMLLTAHLGNWELGALAHGAVVGPMHSVVRPIENALVDRLVERLRCAHGNRVIRKRKAAREILRVLRANGTVGILADQNAVREEGVFVRFFDRPASASKGFAQLALRSGAAVVPAVAWWDGQARRHVVEYGQEIGLVRTGEGASDIASNTQRLQLALEERIRARPEQWLWIHRRWKTQPDDSREPNRFRPAARDGYTT